MAALLHVLWSGRGLRNYREMNYRQVAELICRVTGWWFMTCGVLGAISETLVFLTLRSPGNSSLLTWIMNPLAGIFCGIAISLFARPCALFMVPSGHENSWSPKALTLSSIALVVMVFCGQATSSFLSGLLTQIVNLTAPSSRAFAPYFWFLFVVEVIALGVFVGTPYLARRRFRPYEGSVDEENA